MSARRIALTLALLCALPAGGAVIKTELAGNSLAQYPFFEYVRAFNVNAPVKVAIDPTRFPAIAGHTCNIYVVAHKSASDWAASPTLTDVTPGGAFSAAFSNTNIQANTFQVAGPNDLNANAGTGLGVPYDVVIDVDNSGTLSDGDYIDGLNGEAAFYVVGDTSAPGPLAVAHVTYALDSTVAASFGILGGFEAEDLFYPSNIAAMGRVPLVMIGHGNGHQYTWYGHIGNHLASYGYIVVSLKNNTGPGPGSAATTELGHTDAFLDQAEAGAIAGGALVGHVDSHRIVLIGHSRGAEAVAISYDRLFDGTATPMHFTRQDIRLVTSMLPTDFTGTAVANPHDANYHLWTASGDSDVNGSAGDHCAGGNTQRCQTFHLLDRATAYRQGTIVQGAGHGDFHDEPVADDVDEAFTGPCPLGRHLTHLIQLGYLLPLVKHYVEGNIPALDFMTRPYETFRPIGVPTGNPCIVVSLEYRNGAAAGNFVMDDFQTNPSTAVSSSGGMVTFNVDNLTEGRLDDNNEDFHWTPADPFNGATQGESTDDTRGVVFDWTDADRFMEWQVPAGSNDFTQFRFLSFRGAQGTRHPNTVANLLTFSVTLRDGLGATRAISIGANGGGLTEPYQREGGWHNEMRTVRLRTTDFLNNGAGLDLTNIVAVRFNFGPASGSSKGRIVLDDLMLTNDIVPLSLQIIEPTTARSAFAGTSTEGSRVLVRLIGQGLDLSPGNLTLSVAGIPLAAAQIPTPATQVGAETWVVIAPGPKPNGCYDLSATLTTPSGVGAAQPQSLCWADANARTFDRVLAVDQTNSMNFNGTTGLHNTAKMDAARAAAKFFVDLSNANDKIGVISFQRRDQNHDGVITDPDELAELRFAIVTAGEGATDQRPAARAAINGISPDTSPGFVGPETSVGYGLVKAQTVLTGGAVAGHEPHIVLLTDGLENYPPFWSQAGPGGPLRPTFQAGTTRVDTVGVGQDADDSLLQDISAVTGGQFRHLNEGSGSFFLVSRTAKWYKAVDEDVRGEQRFFYAEGFAEPSLVITHDKRERMGAFLVEPNLDWMTVAFHSNIDGAATVSLFAPGSATPIVAAPPMITVHSEAKHSVYRIRQPMPGTWTYLVEPHDLTAEFFAAASAPASLTARAGPNQLVHRPGGDYLMPLRVWIADTQGVRGATVVGHVRRPDGVEDPVTLIDNGASMDGGANDGIYGLPYAATIPGAYFVDLKATGTSNAGVAFERYLTTGFVLPGQFHRPIPPGEGLPVPPQGAKPGRCNCESEARYSVSYFGGVTIPAGTFDSIADPSFSLGIRPALDFHAAGGDGSLGLYLGYDDFHNSGGGSDFHLTHLSPEIEFSPWTRLCPTPSFHFGLGAYRDESGTVKAGFNVGFGLAICLRQHLSFVSRYDYRSVHSLSRDYSTIQAGLRFSF
jgi:hypothetical protein